MVGFLGAGGEQFDVFLTAREFNSWGGPAFKLLPAPVKECMRDIGICHYMVLLRSNSDGRILQFDFGPRGGDVHVSMPGSRLAKAALSSSSRVLPTEPLELESRGGSTQQQMERDEGELGVPGEIREHWLPELPCQTPLVHLGTTHMSPDQVREFNRQQPTYYLLHDNDCRHYANKLVQRMTGMRKATAVFLKQQYVEKASRAPFHHPHRPLVEALQLLTDVTHWPTIKLATNAAAAALAPLCGMRLLGGLGAAPARLAAGLQQLRVTRALTDLVRTKTGVTMAAAVSRRGQAMAPAALAAASLTAGPRAKFLAWEERQVLTSSSTAATSSTSAENRQGRRKSSRWVGSQAASPTHPAESAASAAVATHGAGAGTAGGAARGRAARVSQSLTAALATAYASPSPASQPLVHLLGQHMQRRRDNVLQAAVHTVSRLHGAAAKVAGVISGAGKATASTLLRLASGGGSGVGSPGALVVRRPSTAPHQVSQWAVAGAGAAAAGPAMLTLPKASGASKHQAQRSIGGFHTRPASAGSQAPFSVAPTEPFAPASTARAPKSSSRFFTRGGAAAKNLLYTHPSYPGHVEAAFTYPGAGGACSLSSSPSPSARAAALATRAFTSALQQQAARWYL